jgi:hypothetical protein
MIVISNSSPLLALSQIQRLDILKHLFGHIYIPDSVFKETVLECNVPIQKSGISIAINDFIEVVTPTIDHCFSRKLGQGERGVLNLIEKQPHILLIDDKRARKEAKDLGFMPSFTSDVLKQAEQQNIISSYATLLKALYEFDIYLP